MEAPKDFDRASALRADLNALEAMLGDAATLLLPVHRGLIWLHGETTPTLTTLAGAEARTLLDLGGELVFLGLQGGQGHFALDLSGIDDPQSLTPLHGSELRDLRFAAAQLSPLQAHLAAFARGMLHFHEITRFCGACGGATRPRKGGHVRVCSQCERELFPRLEPAVLVLAERDDEVLLGRQRDWPQGMYSALAGFVEPGETLEGAALREVREETGVHIEQLRYHSSQPWPFPASLMIGFSARAQPGPITLDEEELEDARFFSRQALAHPDIPGFFVPPPYSLAGRMIAAFLERRSV